MDYKQTSEKSLKISFAWVGLIYILCFLFLGFLIGPYDFDHLSAYYELAWRFLSTSEQLPHFNPYFCGGRTLGGDPQIPIFHPFTLLVPIIGAPWLVRLELLGQLLFGCFGLLGVCRYFKVSVLGQRWALLLYICSGAITAKFLVGHVTLGFFLLFPLFFFFSYALESAQGYHRNRLIVLYGALFLYAGLYKPNFLIYGVPLLLVEHVARAILKRNYKILLYFCLGVGLCGLGNAVIYLPAWKYFSLFPRPLSETRSLVIPFYTFLANLVFPLKTLPEFLYGSQFIQRHEFNFFVGPIAIWFAAIALKKFNKQTDAYPEKLSLLILFVFSMFLGIGGNEGNYLYPYEWFKAAWPGFNSIRVPMRLWFGAFYAIVIFSAIGFKYPRTHRSFAVFLLLGLLPLIVPTTVNLVKTVYLSSGSQWTIKKTDTTPLAWHDIPASQQYLAVKTGKPSLHCVDNVPIAPAWEVTKGPLDIVSTQGDIKVDARFSSWNMFHLIVSGTPGSSFTLNVNSSPLWEFSGQGLTRISEPKQRLTYRLDKKQAIGSATFTQPLIEEGALISLITLIVYIFGSLLVLKPWVRRKA